MNGEKFPLRAFFGHHKCATAWVNRILAEICFHMGVKFKIVHRSIDFKDYDSLGAFVLHHAVDILAYTNANCEHIRDLEVHRGFHVIRDPRDVIVSAYYSHLHSHPTNNWPELEDHRNALRRLSKEEGLLREIEFNNHNLYEMYNWDYNQSHIMELKMEDFVRSPIRHFVHITNFLGLLDDENRGTSSKVKQLTILKMNRLNQKGRRFMPANLPMFPFPRRRVNGIPASTVQQIVQKMSFARMSGGRRRGQENIKSHYRKGVPGDWKNHFSQVHIRHFKNRYDDLLVKLGYEFNNAW